MTEARLSILASIRAKLPFGADGNGNIREESVLAELGVNSLHLITLMLALRREYSLDMNGMTQHGLPTTVGDLVTLVEHGTSAR
jgi:acyl carrier protein